MLRTPMIAAALLTAGALGFAVPSSAATASLGSVLPVLDQPTTSNVEKVAYRKVIKRRGGYNRARHGMRYRYRHGRYAHYYHGWWYHRPWWRGPTVAVGIGVGAAYGGYYGYSAGNPHVRWCLNHYRSYDPRSDTFVGFDGYRHRCNSPFG
jgi:hypothetical protein